MCVVSMIHDYYGPRYPSPFEHTPWITPPPPRPNPKDWDIEQLKQFKELIEKARMFDQLVGDKDCEDPAKTAWMRSIEERLKVVEEQKPQ